MGISFLQLRAKIETLAFRLPFGVAYWGLGPTNVCCDLVYIESIVEALLICLFYLRHEQILIDIREYDRRIFLLIPSLSWS
jgi:hypothetical protein